MRWGHLPLAGESGADDRREQSSASQRCRRDSSHDPQCRCAAERTAVSRATPPDRCGDRAAARRGGVGTCAAPASRRAELLLVVAGAGRGVGARGARLRPATSGRCPLAWPQPAPGDLRHRRGSGGRRRLRGRRVDRRGDPAASELITRVLLYTDQGSWRLTMTVALLGGIAEELFYRGALYTALGRHHPVLISTVVYVAATLASGNLMLGFAAIFLGTVCAWERRATGGVLAPILTHFVWTLVVLLALPPLFGL